MSFRKPPHPMFPANWSPEILEQKMIEGHEIKKPCGCKMMPGSKRFFARCEFHQKLLDEQNGEDVE